LSETKDLHDYFHRIGEKCEEPIKNIVERFNPQKIVSIASGIGVEEIEFEKYGCEVECIEPDKASVEVCKYYIKKLGAKNIKVHQVGVRDFESNKKFDLIYSSCPTDWMMSDFRQAVPKHYLEFFDKYGSEKCVIIVKLYTCAYQRPVLISSWLPRAISQKLNQTRFRLKEYWTSDKGVRAVMIASNYDLPKLNSMEIFRGMTAAKELKTFDGTVWKIEPYLIITKHLIRRVFRKLGYDFLTNW